MIVLVAVVVGAFFVGRVTSSGGTSRADAHTASPTVTVKAAASTTTTLPAVNVDELLESQPDRPLDPATRVTLASQLVLARQAAMQYPTVASARAAGMIQAGEFAPGVGAHFISYSNLYKELLPDGSVNALYPGGYIYDGVDPTSRIVGLMYMSITSAVAPAGFAGPNDHWHRHSNLCIQYDHNHSISVPFAPDRDVTRAQCASVHGDFMGRTVWMVHAWVVPSWESPKGVFSHSNPDLLCANGSTKTNAVGFCQGT
jgi:hypothetical protein